MRACRTVTMLLLLLVVSAAACAHRGEGAAAGRVASDVPVVSVAYSELLDGACAALSGRPLDPERVAAVRRGESDYAALWAARGPALLRAARDVTGVPFRFREMRAALSTCWPGSMSFPLIISLGSPRLTGADSTSADALFVNSLFHEVLHRYINETRREPPGEGTALLAKYRGEPFRVRNHLHLFALQQVVYERLGLEAVWRLSEAADRASSDSAVMGRVHDIVATEGAAAFVTELAAAAPRGKPAPIEQRRHLRAWKITG